MSRDGRTFSDTLKKVNLIFTSSFLLEILFHIFIVFALLHLPVAVPPLDLKLSKNQVDCCGKKVDTASHQEYYPPCLDCLLKRSERRMLLGGFFSLKCQLTKTTSYIMVGDQPSNQWTDEPRKISKCV